MKHVLQIAFYLIIGFIACLVIYTMGDGLQEKTLAAMGPGDTVEILSAENRVEIGVYSGTGPAGESEVTGGENRQVCLTVRVKDAEKGDRTDFIETGVYLYEKNEPYVYTVNKYGRYTVYDYVHCVLVAQTDDPGRLDRVHRGVFENKSRFKDLVEVYPERAGEYPVIRFGDGTVFLEHNTQKDEYYLKSKVKDGEGGDTASGAAAEKKAAVDHVRKFKVKEPYVYIIDCNNFKTIVNYKTHECLYSEYFDRDVLPVEAGEFGDAAGFITVEEAFENK